MEESHRAQMFTNNGDRVPVCMTYSFDAVPLYTGAASYPSPGGARLEGDFFLKRFFFFDRLSSSLCEMFTATGCTQTIGLPKTEIPKLVNRITIYKQKNFSLWNMKLMFSVAITHGAESNNAAYESP